MARISSQIFLPHNRISLQVTQRPVACRSNQLTRTRIEAPEFNLLRLTWQQLPCYEHVLDA